MFTVYRRPVITTRLILALSVLLLSVAFVSGLIASAADDNLGGTVDKTSQFAEGAGFGTKQNTASPQEVAGRVIGYVIAFLGTVFFILMVYGGWIWLLAKGNEDEVKRAKDLIRNAIIGLIIVFAAYVISTFVVSTVLGISTRDGAQPPGSFEAPPDALQG